MEKVVCIEEVKKSLPISGEDGTKSTSSLIFSELRLILKLAWPVILFYVFKMCLSLETIMFVGHLGKIYLDAAALGFMMCNVTGFSILSGLSTALDTLCSQAYGAKHYRQTGIMAQRGLIVLFLACLPIAGIWMNTGPLLVLFGQDSQVAALSMTYTRVMILALPFEAIFFTLQKYLQSQGIILPIAFIGLLVNIVNVLVSWLIIYVLGWGFSAAPFAVVCSEMVLALLLSLFVMYSPRYCHPHYMTLTDSGKEENGEEHAHDSQNRLDLELTENTHFVGIRKWLWKHRACVPWPQWSMEVFQDWGHLIHLALPGLFMVCLEWWSYELTILLAGLLGTVELAVYAIIFQVWGFSFMGPLGMSVAVSVRLGNLLGANLPSHARRAAMVSFLLSMCWTTFVVLLVSLARFEIPRAFTSDVTVAKLTGEVLLIVAFAQIFDTLQGVCSGILRGCGRQKIGAIVNFFGYYLVGVPFSIMLTFGAITHMGVFGCVTGLSIGLAVQVVCFLVIILRQDWDYFAAMAQKRLKAPDIEENRNSTDSTDEKSDQNSVIINGGSSKAVNHDADLDRRREYRRIIAATCGAACSFIIGILCAIFI